MALHSLSQPLQQRKRHPLALRRVLMRALTYFFLLIAVGITLLPLLYAFFASFKPLGEMLAGGAELLPHTWNLQNYRDAWRLANFARYFGNSVLVTAAVVLLDLFTSSMCGYVLARQRTALTRLIQGLFGVTLFLGVGTATLYPRFFLALQLGMLNLSGVVVVELAGITVVHTLLIQAYCQSLDAELYDAARLDGCGFFGIYWHIALPLMQPIIATTAILAFQAAWNSFQVPLVFTLSNPDLRTLTVGVYALKISSEGATSWNIMLAGAMLAVLPTIVVFFFLQKYFIRGVTQGALKG
jgi:ABC-type glycerol-3-phosphate transport system permease component